MSLDVTMLPPNSHKYHESKEKKAEEEEPKKIERVATGKVVKKKKSFGRKFAELFLAEDIGSVREYLFYDVLIPAIKNGIVEMVQNGTEMLFNGRIKPKGKPIGGGGYFAYNRVSSGNGAFQESRPVRSRYSFEDIYLESRAEAEEVLDTMLELLDRYGSVRVADLYELVGVTGNGYTDNNFGWKDLRAASVNRTRDGYLLKLPPCIQFDD